MFSVPSQSREGVSYLVKVFGQEWTCDCPDFVNRADKIDGCKHIFAVKFWIAARAELEQKPKPKVFAGTAIQSAKCGSIRVVKNGIKRQRQAFVKPHAALEGQTPAERASVGVKGQNKWLELLKASLTVPKGVAN